MTLSDIISQLSEMGGTGTGFGTIYGTPEVAGITPSQIASVLGGMYDLTAQQLPSDIFSGSTIGMPLLQSTLQKTYSPQIESEGQHLLGGLLKQTSGEKSKKAAGGFAGSGQFSRYMTGAKDVYGKGMTNVLTTVGQQKAQGAQSIQDIIDSWHETAQSLAG